MNKNSSIKKDCAIKDQEFSTFHKIIIGMTLGISLVLIDQGLHPVLLKGEQELTPVPQIIPGNDNISYDESNYYHELNEAGLNFNLTKDELDHKFECEPSVVNSNWLSCIVKFQGSNRYANFEFDKDNKIKTIDFTIFNDEGEDIENIIALLKRTYPAAEPTLFKNSYYFLGDKVYFASDPLEDSKLVYKK